MVVRGGGIEVSAHTLHLLADLPRRAATGALKEHVLDEM
jgi:hypothetical protein